MLCFKAWWHNSRLDWLSLQRNATHLLLPSKPCLLRMLYASAPNGRCPRFSDPKLTQVALAVLPISGLALLCVRQAGERDAERTRDQTGCKAYDKHRRVFQVYHAGPLFVAEKTPRRNPAKLLRHGLLVNSPYGKVNVRPTSVVKTPLANGPFVTFVSTFQVFPARHLPSSSDQSSVLSEAIDGFGIAVLDTPMMSSSRVNSPPTHQL